MAGAGPEVDRSPAAASQPASVPQPHTATLAHKAPSHPMSKQTLSRTTPPRPRDSPRSPRLPSLACHLSAGSFSRRQKHAHGRESSTAGTRPILGRRRCLGQPRPHGHRPPSRALAGHCRCRRRVGPLAVVVLARRRPPLPSRIAGRRHPRTSPAAVVFNPLPLCLHVRPADAALPPRPRLRAHSGTNDGS